MRLRSTCSVASSTDIRGRLRTPLLNLMSVMLPVLFCRNIMPTSRRAVADRTFGNSTGQVGSATGGTLLWDRYLTMLATLGCSQLKQYLAGLSTLMGRRWGLSGLKGEELFWIKLFLNTSKQWRPWILSDTSIFGLQALSTRATISASLSSCTTWFELFIWYA